MKTTILLDVATMIFLGYLTLSDGDRWELILFAILLITNVIKWITTPKEQRK